MTQVEITEAVKKHIAWLNKKPGGIQWVARRVILYKADLQSYQLREADFSYADLRWSDMRDTDLRGAVFFRTFMMGADLRGADIRGVDFANAVTDYCRWEGCLK